MNNKYKTGFWCMIICITATAFAQKTQGKNNRWVGKTEYSILDSRDFYLYERYEPVEVNRGKGMVMKTEYFFSKDADSKIEPLTILNVENAFAENARFRYALETHRCNEDLISYDPYLKEYKIKYLYDQSVK
jgi:hypothetical protein